MKKFLKKIFKTEKRGWIPLEISQTDSFPRTQSGNLPQVKRCLQLYRDLMLSSPIIAENSQGEQVEDQLIEVLESPCSWLNKSEFFTKLVQDYFLAGNFYCYIKESEGEVTELLPFPESAIFAYVKTDKGATPSGDSSDPLMIDQQGFYYQSQFATGEKTENNKPKMRINKFSSDQIWHLKNMWQSGGDQLNGNSLFAQYPESLDFARDILDTLQAYSASGLVPPSVISGITEMPADQRQSLVAELDKFFNEKKRFLALDDSIKLENSIIQNPSQALMILSSISSLHLSRIFAVPISLLGREDGASTDVGVSMKESHRFWIKNSGKAFLKIVSDKLSELSLEGNKIKFQWRSSQLADLREAQVLDSLLEKQIITTEKAKEWLND